MGRCRVLLRTYTKIESGVAAFCRRLRTAPQVHIFASTAGFALLEAVLSSVLVAIAGMKVLRFWIECLRGPVDTLPTTPTGICQYQ